MATASELAWTSVSAGSVALVSWLLGAGPGAWVAGASTLVALLVRSARGDRVARRGSDRDRDRDEVAALRERLDRLEAERALLESAGRMARVGGWRLDLTTMTPLWSPEVYRIHEVELDYQPSLEEAVKFYAPEAREDIRLAVQRSIAEGIGWDLEVPFVTAKGRRLWVRAMGVPEMQDGRCVRLWGAFQDVTDRRVTEQRLSTAVQASNIGLWDWNVVDDATYFNDTFYTMLGYEPGELPMTLATWKALCHPEDLDGALADIHAYFEGRTERYQNEHRLRRKDGSWHWIRDVGEAVERDEATGQVTRMIGLHVDIQSLKEMTTRLELALTSGNVGIWDWDVVTGRLVTNATFHEMIGEEPPAEPIDGSYFFDRLHPEDAAETEAAVARAHHDESSGYDVEFRMRKRDGSYAWVRSVGRVIERDEAGAPVRMIGQHTDVSAQRRVREAMRVLNQRLRDETARAAELAAAAEEANRSKSQFLASTSHEIRTPLTSILGYTELLMSDAAELDAATRNQALDTIHRAGQHLMTVINDILDLSKIEAGKMTVERLEVALPEVLCELERLLAPRAMLKGLDFRTVLETPIPERVVTDPTRLRQILMNVVGNSVKFTEEGRVELRVRLDGGDLLVRVTDTGPGIADDAIGTLFQPFVQAADSVARRHGGTGLGLVICSRFADMLGGSIELERSVPGEGATFVIRLPANVPEGVETVADLRPPSAEADPAPGPSGGPAPRLSGRILLAEDGADNQRLISFLLRKAGAEVEVVENGALALERVTSAVDAGAPFDLVLTDMVMPEMDGYALIRHLRDEGHSVPIVALTANAMVEDRERCLAAGCDDYASKPIDRQGLIETCRQWLARGRGASGGS